GPFELSLTTGDLSKSGRRLKLSGQALEVLLLLAANPGKTVTREELQQRLWGQATFVGFEHGLNSAVKRLREVLNDSASSPRYIETMHGRRYRLIGSTGGCHSSDLRAESSPHASLQELPAKSFLAFRVAVVLCLGFLVALSVALLITRRAAPERP